MPGNNPNQNRSLKQNRGKHPIRGFAGMRKSLEERKKTHDHSAQEVDDARKANALGPERLGKKFRDPNSRDRV